MRPARWALLGLGLLLMGGALFFRTDKGAATALPAPYDRLARALSTGDRQALWVLVREEGYAALVAARALAEDGGLSPAERVRWARFVLEEEGDRARLWAARVLEEAGALDEAARLYRAELLKEQALAGLLGLARRGSQEAVRGLLNARRYREALAYARDPLLKGRALLGLGRAEEALPYLRGDPRLLGKALLRLGREKEALSSFRSAGARLEAGRLLVRMGRVGEAIPVLLAAGARGRFEAAGLLEAGDADRAVRLYLELSGEPGVLADDAAFRAWVLARRRGDGASEHRAYMLLSGGLGLLAGKPLPPIRVLPPPPAPEGLGVVQALLRAGHGDWALGEAAYRARRAGGEVRRAWAWVLEALGEPHLAARYGGPLLRWGTPWREAIFAEAERFGLDPGLLFAVMRVESAFDPGAVSPTGAKGLFQFTARTWREVAERLGEREADPFDPRAAIRFGAYYLAWLKDRFGGDLRLAVLAYNGGPGYVSRGMRTYGNFEDFLRFQPRDEPREYFAKVWRDYAVYRALANRRPPPPGWLEAVRPRAR